MTASSSRVAVVLGSIGPVGCVEASSSSGVPLSLSPGQEALVAVIDAEGALHPADKGARWCVTCLLLVQAARLEAALRWGALGSIAKDAGAGVRVAPWEEDAPSPQVQPPEEVVEMTASSSRVAAVLPIARDALQEQRCVPATAESDCRCPPPTPSVMAPPTKAPIPLFLPVHPSLECDACSANPDRNQNSMRCSYIEQEPTTDIFVAVSHPCSGILNSWGTKLNMCGTSPILMKRRPNEAGETVTSLSTRFINEFLIDIPELQCLPPTCEPCVTEHIDHIIELITKDGVVQGYELLKNDDIFLLKELMEDRGENNPFGEANQNALFASLVNYDQDTMLPDVSVSDVAAGKDMQGIPWEKMLFGRDQYRETKTKHYRNYQNLGYAREDALQVQYVKGQKTLVMLIGMDS